MRWIVGPCVGALLAGAVALGGESAALPAECGPPACRTGGLHAWWARRAQANRPLPSHVSPFVAGAYRYEPRIRDIRYVRQHDGLPGHDAGIAETLPVIPARRWGFFVLPVDPVD